MDELRVPKCNPSQVCEIRRAACLWGRGGLSLSGDSLSGQWVEIMRSKGGAAAGMTSGAPAAASSSVGYFLGLPRFPYPFILWTILVWL